MEHIHTIPVLDALRNPEGCAFCVMFSKLENDAINFMMGPSYMEEDVRMATNKTGFCKRHMEAMYKHQNRLGLALMLHSHLQKLNQDTVNIIQNRTPVSFFRKDPANSVTKLKNHLQSTVESCYVCTKIETTAERYIDTFFYLWGRGGEEKRLIESQKSYCLPHLIDLLAKLDKISKREKFIDHLMPMIKLSLAEIEGDLEWFIQKFDHQNANEPWKNSKDALPRAIALLGGGTL